MEENVPLPRHVMLELTNVCDLACRHCSYHGENVRRNRPIGRMAEPVWRAALAEIGGWGVDVDVQPWGMGEPLLSPHLWEVVATAKRWPRLTVGFFTNGMQWRDDGFAAALDSGLDWLVFSIDGLRPDVFAHYRVGGDLARVLESLRGMWTARQRRGAVRPHISVNMVQYPELADHADEFVAAMRDTADAVMVSRFRPDATRRFSPIELPRVPCYQLDTILVMGWNGGIASCCEDPQGEVQVGTFPECSLREIWYGEALARLRAAHRAGNYAASPLCAGCDAWSQIYQRERTVPGMRIRERTSATIHDYIRAAAPPC